MKYKIMKLVCMFDLPVDTEQEKRNYRRFRKTLIEEGFIMMQYSVYIRTCPNRDYAERLAKRLEKGIPVKGNVRLLVITEKQYDDMKIIVGKKSDMENAIGTERLVII